MIIEKFPALATSIAFSYIALLSAPISASLLKTEDAICGTNVTLQNESGILLDNQALQSWINQRGGCKSFYTNLTQEPIDPNPKPVSNPDSGGEETKVVYRFPVSISGELYIAGNPLYSGEVIEKAPPPPPDTEYDAVVRMGEKVIPPAVIEQPKPTKESFYTHILK